MSSALKKIVDAKTLRSLVTSGAINKEGVRLFDCALFINPRPDWKQFKEQSYGKFETLVAAETRAKKLYEGAHIPGAVHCDLDIATYPSKYERFTFYPAEVFEQYIQLLGVEKGEHIIVYGRGAQGAMLFAGKIAWLLKSYGQEKLSLLDGGLDYWLKQKYELSDTPAKLEKGDWRAVDRIAEFNTNFDELETADASGKQFIERTDETRFLDARIRGQFEGTEETGLDPYMVTGSHIPGFINVPSAELTTLNGVLKSPEEIKQMCPQSSQPIVTSCNTGVQASYLAYALDAADASTKPRVYPGSLKEMEKRDPKKISAGKEDLLEGFKKEKKKEEEVKKNYDLLL